MAILAFVGLGSNVASPARQLAHAIAALAAFPETRLLAVSSFYRSVPIGTKGRQPDFINAVAAIETSLTADALLAALRAVERAARRRRTGANAPRSLDLDLLLYGALRRAGRKLEVPHPRLHLRAFVLRPLLEISPQIAIPGRGRARKFLQRTRTQNIARLSTAPRPAAPTST
ncbi:MAG: 2-amino-4-hydroxy-6-hydroxymethyldihydropteridine diphosphokinase [Betaproteobacteria bacterium]|nr:2-amino-4-hydroxy-6-hydroxymethyldihydropteridine diphosphokinase [Betaproteobacteria bacterium]MBA3775318.1 2-amino-4-hydroxy-6-hydroxymethyldihydropteridine diphosphokinase [Betaproteobacteria bacterium]